MESEVREEKMLLRGRTHLENAIIEELKKKSDSGSDEPIDVGVTSFKGRTGVVTPEAGDYTAAQVGALALTGGTVTGDVSFKTRVSEGTSSATGDYSHAEGSFSPDALIKESPKATVLGAHAEGISTVASGKGSHAEGACYSDSDTPNTASGYGSHSEGNSTTASGQGSHAEGGKSIASARCSHAEGYSSVAGADYSHAGGYRSEVETGADYSHAEGYYNIAAGKYSFVIGMSNVRSTDGYNYLIVGDGGSQGSNRANVFRIHYQGVYSSVSINTSGADYAEMFEWKDSNPNGEDRVGRFVTLDGTKIRLATGDDDFILGIVSATPSVLGDNHSDQWRDMFARDIFGRRIIDEKIDEETGEKIIEKKINPNYRNAQPYIGRSDRPEWAPVGLLGKLIMIDDGSCEVNGWAKPFLNGIATKSEERTKYRVMERLDESHIRVLILS